MIKKSVIKKLKLHIAEKQDFDPIVLRQLDSNFEMIDFNNTTNLKEILSIVDIFWFRLAYQINRAVLNQNSNCKILVTPVTGIDHIDETLCKSLGVKIISLRGETEFLKSIRATAEHTIALTLALLRKIVPASNHTKNGLWNRDMFRGHELYEKKIGILGLGRLGSIVAEYFIAFGCSVYYYDIDLLKNHPKCTRVNSLEELCKIVDILSIHIPLNNGTIDIINEGILRSMKPTSILINTSRGAVINGQDLYSALEQKIIAAAALDVMTGEPNNLNQNLIDYAMHHDSLLITPHIGGNTYESFAKTENFMAEKLIAYTSQN